MIRVTYLEPFSLDFYLTQLFFFLGFTFFFQKRLKEVGKDQSILTDSSSKNILVACLASGLRLSIINKASFQTR